MYLRWQSDRESIVTAKHIAWFNFKDGVSAERIDDAHAGGTESG